MQNAKDWKTAFPDGKGRIENTIVDGHKGAAEVVWTGTNTGALNGMPPTNKPVSMRGMVSITEQGGKIANSRHYLDVAGMMTQLGVTPGAAGARQPVGSR
jgi:steroid delta-isomerase-like uncharacterized protein